MLDAAAPLPDDMGSLRNVALDTARATRVRQRRLEQEQREFNLALEESARQQTRALSLLEATINAMPGGIVAVDLRGHISVWNPHIAQLWQVPLDMMSRRNFQEIGEFCAAQLAVPDEWPRFAEQNVAASKHEFLLKDGRSLECHVAPQMIGMTQTGFVMHWQDITERNKAEAAIIAAKKAAEAVNRELTRSNADLEQFAYVASHDLQEPLRSVASSVQLLQMRYAGRLDARADEFIKHAVGGATRMKTLIDDLLAFSRIGAKREQTEELSMEHVLSEAMRNLEVAILESNAKITHDPLPNLHGYGAQIAQLLQNLISNACKFRGDKAAVVHVRADREGSEWVFSVADQGIGINSKYFERVFELFKRLHTREEYAGTGIGLALCKKIVERHGGRIWVESEKGRGTTFFFTLPA